MISTISIDRNQSNIKIQQPMSQLACLLIIFFSLSKVCVETFNFTDDFSEYHNIFLYCSIDRIMIMIMQYVNLCISWLLIIVHSVRKLHVWFFIWKTKSLKVASFFDLLLMHIRFRAMLCVCVCVYFFSTSHITYQHKQSGYLHSNFSLYELSFGCILPESNILTCVISIFVAYAMSSHARTLLVLWSAIKKKKIKLLNDVNFCILAQIYLSLHRIHSHLHSRTANNKIIDHSRLFFFSLLQRFRNNVNFRRSLPRRQIFSLDKMLFLQFNQFFFLACWGFYYSIYVSKFVLQAIDSCVEMSILWCACSSVSTQNLCDILLIAHKF